MVKETGLYDILNIKPSADDAQIKSAYRKLAIKHHPDKNKDKDDTMFKKVSHAFQVLSDPDQRKMYDQFGESGLNGAPPPRNSTSSSSSNFSGFSSAFPGATGASTGGPSNFKFSTGSHIPTQDAHDIFTSFFGTSSPFTASSFSSSSDPSSSARPHNFSSFSSSSFGGMPGGLGGAGFGGGDPFASASAPPMDVDSDDPASDSLPPPESIRPLPIALEDLYKGTTKRLKVTRKLLNGSSEEKIIDVKITAGWKPGTKLKYADCGNQVKQGRKIVSQTLVFVIEEKKHEKFQRIGDDLIYTLDVPLADALCGPQERSKAKQSITSLDGHPVSVMIPYPNIATGGSPLKPNQEIRVPNQGFPITRKNPPKPKGDLIVKINVVFPDKLSGSQAASIAKVFRP